MDPKVIPVPKLRNFPTRYLGMHPWLERCRSLAQPGMDHRVSSGTAHPSRVTAARRAVSSAPWAERLVGTNSIRSDENLNLKNIFRTERFHLSSGSLHNTNVLCFEHHLHGIHQLTD